MHIKVKVLYVNLEIQPAFFRERIAQVARSKGVELDSAWTSGITGAGSLITKP